ncbi:MAG: UDP-galactopyranose mutase [Alphaproteobacteria bacterium]|nr:UDP-galactopyranose mutase [Alphaproteobacteria bacterium]
MAKIKHLVVGAGISGATLAERIANVLHEPVVVIDSRNHIGGNCFDYVDKTGIRIHKYGPHIFHTNNQDVWDYLSQFTSWHPFFLRVRAYIDGKTVPFSFNLNSIAESFPPTMAQRLTEKLIEKLGYGHRISILQLRESKDADLAFLADFIYNKGFLNYYKKQWGCTPEELDASVAERVPISISTSDDYFIDRYQGIPSNGWTPMIRKMLDNPLITVRLNTPFDKSMEYENLYYTGPIDEFFNFEFGELPYRSLTFDIRTYNQEYFQNNVVVSYPNNYDFTRICEHKYFLDDKSDKTVVSFEYPSAFVNGKNERYYPIPRPENARLYEKYLVKAQTECGNTFFFGRLGDYKYYNIDMAVARALNLFDEIKKREGGNVQQTKSFGCCANLWWRKIFK